MDKPESPIRFEDCEVHVGHGDDLRANPSNFRAKSNVDLGKHTLLERMLRDPEAKEKLSREARRLGRKAGKSALLSGRTSNRAERRLAMAGTIGYPCRGNPAKASRRATVRQAKRRTLIKEARDAHLAALEAKTNA